MYRSEIVAHLLQWVESDPCPYNPCLALIAVRPFAHAGDPDGFTVYSFSPIDILNQMSAENYQHSILWTHALGTENSALPVETLRAIIKIVSLGRYPLIYFAMPRQNV